ncbi:radical SAM protein [bacterium]|nr:radical SAM protein [bacterium]
MTPKIVLENGLAFVEITLRCYCGCPWCYKGGEVHTKGMHLPLESIKARIDWLVKNTNCKTIGLIGGEPGLHPQLKEICEYVFGLNLELRITTSGKFSKREQKNMEYLLDLYRKGLIQINLSFHPGRNEEGYVNFVKRIKLLLAERRQCQAKGGVFETIDLYTMVTVDKDLAFNEEGIRRILTLLMETSDHHSLEFYGGTVADLMATLQNNYVDFESSQNLSYQFRRTSDSDLFRHEFTFSGLVLFEDRPDGTRHGVMAKGHICSISFSRVENGVISLPAMIVKTNGEFGYVHPHCIPAKNGLCNVDLHSDVDQIRKTIEQSLLRIRTIVFLANRRKAARECGADGTEKQCTACPLDDMCDACHASVRDD